MTGAMINTSETAARRDAAQDPAGGASVTVYYDGACPLCSAEIAHYRGRPGAERVAFIDATTCPDTALPADLTREAALARFHVRGATGRLVAGGRAFAVLWSALPGYAFAGRLFRAPPLAWLIDGAYALFLRLRPRLQGLARRLSRR
jgi:predicted DCC family thiol-disulfide oxidoreductase YuxK